MPDAIAVHGFETSNNFKVRIALGYKGLDYTFHAVTPSDRERIVELSGQHLTPVLVHGDRVVFDSAAILRYLDVAFPATPKLFGATMAEQWAIEDLELFARAILAGPMMELVHTKVLGGAPDDAMRRRCTDDFTRAVERLIGTLGNRPWLVGDAMSAADITAAAVMFRVRSAELFPLPDAAASLVDWEARVLAHDGQHRLS